MTSGALPAALTGIVLIAFWLGAAIIVSLVVAPAAFEVLPTRALAGAVIGRALSVLFVAGILCGAIVAVLSTRMGAGRVVTMASLAFATASAAALGIAMRIVHNRALLGVPLDALDPADPRRVAFGRLHGLSVLCLGLGAVAAFTAAAALVRRLTVATASVAP